MINPMSLQDRNIIVTGASAGIGRETSILLSQLGARVLLVARNVEQLHVTQSMLEGGSHQLHPFDLSAVDDIPRWLKNISTISGPIHGIAHCAGIQSTRPLRVSTAEHVEQIFRINVASAIFLAKGFRQKGVCHSQGSIVFVSSVMGLVGQPGQSSYSASKGALIALVKSLALEVAREGIRVNCVVPALVNTSMSAAMLSTMSDHQVAQVELMHPLGLGCPRDVANAIAFLLADTGRWITGTALTVDGGYTAH